MPIKRAEVGRLGARAPVSSGRLTVMAPVLQDPSPRATLEDQARGSEAARRDGVTGQEEPLLGDLGSQAQLLFVSTCPVGV